ncbi:MAG: choline ABC transporter ATP-binding protein, partial [Notoacmeibacter sp.]|nr:choline ABC transporter ATP-binding protein [Notoacmeibacter sp.]
QGVAPSGENLSATTGPSTPVRDIIASLAARPGIIGVVEKGKVLGQIGSADIVRAIARYQRPDSHN